MKVDMISEQSISFSISGTDFGNWRLYLSQDSQFWRLYQSINQSIYLSNLLFRYWRLHLPQDRQFWRFRIASHFQQNDFSILQNESFSKWLVQPRSWIFVKKK